MDDDDKILKEFQKIVAYRKILFMITGAGAIMAMLSESDSKLLLWIGVIMIIFGAILEAVCWRCPVCGKGLPMRESGENIKHCPNCGVRLNI